MKVFFNVLKIKIADFKVYKNIMKETIIALLIIICFAIYRGKNIELNILENFILKIYG